MLDDKQFFVEKNGLIMKLWHHDWFVDLYRIRKLGKLRKAVVFLNHKVAAIAVGKPKLHSEFELSAFLRSDAKMEADLLDFIYKLYVRIGSKLTLFPYNRG